MVLNANFFPKKHLSLMSHACEQRSDKINCLEDIRVWKKNESYKERSDAIVADAFLITLCR